MGHSFIQKTKSLVFFFREAEKKNTTCFFFPLYFFFPSWKSSHVIHSFDFKAVFFFFFRFVFFFPRKSSHATHSFDFRAVFFFFRHRKKKKQLFHSFIRISQKMHKNELIPGKKKYGTFDWTPSEILRISLRVIKHLNIIMNA